MLGVTWSLTMEVNKSEATRRPHPISTPDFRPKLSECNSSVSLIMQSNGLGGSSLEKCIKSVFPTQVKIWIIHTILQFLGKIVEIFISIISWQHCQNWFYYFPEIETSKKALLGYKIDLQKVITIAAFYSMFYIFLYFASNYDLVILLWNVHSYICTYYYIFQMQFI